MYFRADFWVVESMLFFKKYLERDIILHKTRTLYSLLVSMWRFWSSSVCETGDAGHTYSLDRILKHFLIKLLIDKTFWSYVQAFENSSQHSAKM